MVSHVPTGGNPGGYIQTVMPYGGEGWEFIAPARYLGNRSGAYGQTITFDVRQVGSSDWLRIDIYGNGVYLTRYLSVPGSTWSSYSVLVSASGGWINLVTGQPATATEISTALSSITQISVHGYTSPSSSVTAGLDNFILRVSQP
jgi:hypothetical protein